MLYKSKAIVLHSLKYGDTGLIVRTYTHELGRESFIIQGVRKKKSRFNPYLFEPLSIINLDFYYKQNQNIHRIKDVKYDVHLQNMHFDIPRITIATFLAEILLHTLGESESNPQLFDYLYHAIQILDVVDDGIENYHIVFLVQLSKFLGIHPANNDSLYEYLTHSHIEINDLLNASLSDLNSLKITSQNRKELLDQLIKYYQNHLHGFGEIKSLTVFRELFR